MKKTILTAIGTVLGLVLVVGIFALLLMLLMNIAFPLLAFGYWQAMALLGIAFIVGLPAMKS